MRVAVFTARSTGIGIATGVLVTAVFGQFVGASWGLAILAGLPAGALALAGSIILQGVTGVSSFFWRAASRIARLSSRGDPARPTDPQSAPRHPPRAESAGATAERGAVRKYL